jgi:hypothetical protein
MFYVRPSNYLSCVHSLGRLLPVCLCCCPQRVGKTIAVFSSYGICAQHVYASPARFRYDPSSMYRVDEWDRNGTSTASGGTRTTRPRISRARACCIGVGPARRGYPVGCTVASGCRIICTGPPLGTGYSRRRFRKSAAHLNRYDMCPCGNDYSALSSQPSAEDNNRDKNIRVEKR